MEKRTVETREYKEEMKCTPIEIKVSTLSLEDSFLKYEPKTENQKKLKDSLINVIKSELPDFRIRFSSFDEEGKNLGIKTPISWSEQMKNHMPERDRIKERRTAFLGILIKYLVEEKKIEVENAWKIVCDPSRNLGDYLKPNL